MSNTALGGSISILLCSITQWLDDRRELCRLVESSVHPIITTNTTVLLILLFVSNLKKHAWCVEEITDVLICRNVETTKICTQQPVYVWHNATFEVYLNSLDLANDIKADENGVWERNGSPVVYVSVHTKGPKREVFCRSQLTTILKLFEHITVTLIHQTLGQFRHIIVTVHGNLVSTIFFKSNIHFMTHLDYKNVQQDLGMVVYEFDHQEHSIDIKPHGNSTEKLTRTKPSTIHLWKTEVEKKAPIKVLRNVENIKRGIMKAASSGYLPQNRKQIYNLQQRNKSHSNVYLLSCATVCVIYSTLNHS